MLGGEKRDKKRKKEKKKNCESGEIFLGFWQDFGNEFSSSSKKKREKKLKSQKNKKQKNKKQKTRTQSVCFRHQRLINVVNCRDVREQQTLELSW